MLLDFKLIYKLIFLYVTRKQKYNEMTKVLFKIAIKSKRYLRINLIKDIQDKRGEKGKA